MVIAVLCGWVTTLTKVVYKTKKEYENIVKDTKKHHIEEDMERVLDKD